MTITNGAPKAASNGVLADVERLRQKDYWTEHSKEATVEAMMLDSCAKTIDAEERPEVGWPGCWAGRHCFHLCLQQDTVCMAHLVSVLASFLPKSCTPLL